ncbi:MAG: hypothetical protein NC344_01180 [Bacteroidales bacterium]|nr:hypothetical protein [Bacteroidales bacterium]MCM1146449.1 hypothetical protein [Bacteroidales bacterium]MCM1205113.1 hypothetical protein [Bacillota bacterium]MCM1509359.1 hypothetical protein [Clostridium sp.]
MANKKQKQGLSDSLDNAVLFYGLLGIAILAVSLIAAVKVGNDFCGDGMVRTATFLGCNTLLWLCYYSVFIFLPDSIMNAYHKRQDKVPVMQQEEIIEQPPTYDVGVKPVDYKIICREYETKQAKAKSELAASIIEYVGRTMPPFVADKDMEHLCTDIRCWCFNPGYKPSDIRLRVRLSTNELCHFVWNIGERLGRYNSCDGECRALFAKRLFASALSDVELPSLKNMTKTTSADRIAIDRPSPDSLKFHYQATENNTGVHRESA